MERLAPLVTALGSVAVVDLETTGLPGDPAAEILEVGIVALDLEEHPRAGRSLRVRTLDGLLRQRASIPLAIQRLTGLRDRDVETAPRLADVGDQVAAALRGRTLIAHNADFERAFLSRFIAPQIAQAQFLDTQDLLALTHPDAPDLRLESFTRELLVKEERHRALADALDTLRVLCAIAAAAERGDSRYRTARSAMERYTPESAWLALLDGVPFGEPREQREQFVEIAESHHPAVPFDEDAIARVLADSERGRAYFPGYRVRQEQIDLARHFVRNLRDGGTLLLEGGTGVGKSLAYLAALIPFIDARKRSGIREPVVVSTRTKLLQDQLLRKDIPAAARFLGVPGLRVLSIKGRANYVCQRRLSRVLEEGRDHGMFPAERQAYAVLQACAEIRSHGEIGSLPAAMLRRYPSLRELLRRSVAARAEACSREDCAKTPGCPFAARRAALAAADLIVANHDLLLRWPPDYPEFGHVVADEAHELAGVADEVYADEVRPSAVLERIDEIFGKPSEPRGEALLPRKLCRKVATEVAAWRREIDLDLAKLGRQLATRASEYGEVQLSMHPERVMPESAELAEIVAQRIDGVSREAELLDDKGGESDGEAESAVMRAAMDLRAAARGLRLAFAGDDEFVSSFDGLLGGDRNWRLAIRPVSAASSFHADFLENLESFAAVSASLFVAGDAFAALGELEIEQRPIAPLVRYSVESPFPYREHMRALALEQVEDLVSETAEVIERVARKLGGRTLGLFTSLRRMNEVAAILDQRFEGSGIEILAPRRAGDDPAALVERFVRARGGAVLLGARTFWQGLDLPGSDLQAVVIEKLPFEVPTELRRRREARIRLAGGDPFGRFTLGKMLLHLKQMTGRLIRSETDRGLVIIVEGRTRKRYFSRLSSAFPSGVSLRAGHKEAIPELIRELDLGVEKLDD